MSVWGILKALADGRPWMGIPMSEQVRAAPPTLYERDETAWADLTARLVDERRWDEVDADNLSEYLRDMARRDRREVHSAST